ncbi:DUF1634 domain-containing protein [Mastigocladopsis repens]|uniref:DUF1634 domain-containing protein n=1 Tax=Mastigocladopsis repens TaxID=221287 RepID=UPI00031881C3|nr:DUF1634 domain-containing protein [Mastigocladopsis repens]
MNKTSFGFWWGSSTPLESEVIRFKLQEKKPDSDIQELAQQRVSMVAKFPNDCEVDANKEGTKTLGELQLEQLLSNFLKYGVIFASSVVLIGGILYLIRHGAERADYQFFQGEPSDFRSPAGVLTAVLSGSRRGIIQLGLLLLVATPIIRVVISLFIFIRQREFTYVLITLIVLTALIYSLVGASY